jgi:hypothetical protein
MPRIRGRELARPDMNTMSAMDTLWPLVPIACHLGIQVWGTVTLRSAKNKIGGRIRSVADLNIVRRAIQMNLQLGLLVVANLIPLTLALFLSRVGVMIGYIGILAVGQAVLWFTARPVEKQFKSLPVEGNNPELASEYRSYVEQWSGFHVSLRPPKRSAGK